MGRLVPGPYLSSGQTNYAQGLILVPEIRNTSNTDWYYRFTVKESQDIQGYNGI